MTNRSPDRHPAGRANRKRHPMKRIPVGLRAVAIVAALAAAALFGTGATTPAPAAAANGCYISSPTQSGSTSCAVVTKHWTGTYYHSYFAVQDMSNVQTGCIYLQIRKANESFYRTVATSCSAGTVAESTANYYAASRPVAARVKYDDLVFNNVVYLTVPIRTT